MKNILLYSFRFLITIAATIIALVLIVPDVAQAQDYRFISIRHPDAATDKDTTIIAVNSGKTIIGSYTDVKKVRHGYLYDIDTAKFTTYDHPNAGTAPAQGTQFNAINNTGRQVGFYTDNTGLKHAFVYDSISKKSFDYPIRTYETFNPVFINDSGMVAGQYTDKDNGVHGYLFNSVTNTLTILDHPKATTKQDENREPLHYQGTYIVGINNEGMVVGHYTDFKHLIRGFVYDSVKRKYVQIDPPNASPAYTVGTEPAGISNKGMVVGSFLAKFGRHLGFLYDCTTRKITTFEVLSPGDPEFNHTEPKSINNKGLVAGTTYNVNNMVNGLYVFQSFLYNPVTGKPTVINHPKFPTGTLLRTINDEGVILGYGIGGNQTPPEYFVAIPILTSSPEAVPKGK